MWHAAPSDWLRAIDLSPGLLRCCNFNMAQPPGSSQLTEAEDLERRRDHIALEVKYLRGLPSLDFAKRVYFLAVDQHPPTIFNRSVQSERFINDMYTMATSEPLQFDLALAWSKRACCPLLVRFLLISYRLRQSSWSELLLFHSNALLTRIQCPLVGMRSRAASLTT